MQAASHPGRDGMRELSKLPRKLFSDILTHMHGAPCAGLLAQGRAAPGRSVGGAASSICDSSC